MNPERYNVALAPTNRILNVKPFMRHLRPLLGLAACVRRSTVDDAAEAGTDRRCRAVFAPRSAAQRSRYEPAVDCLGEAEKAQRLIRTTLAIYAEDGDPAPLRPVAKTIAKPESPLRQCLERAYYLPNDQLDEATRNHARDALEYAASVVEFDAFDRVWKTSQPKQSLTQYTAEGLQYSKRALEAVDRELGLFVFGCKVKGRSYFGVS